MTLIEKYFYFKEILREKNRINLNIERRFKF